MSPATNPLTHCCLATMIPSWSLSGSSSSHHRAQRRRPFYVRRAASVYLNVHLLVEPPGDAAVSILALQRRPARSKQRRAK
ncbi:hypothetical protein AURDEDRAFT_174076 [Auricularia subglabra TFB-10046 SS5]|nr:hypothetical protein AURDEDRAFT_174076 [Auricularia subglabra TFB-10046 SS5]